MWIRKAHHISLFAKYSGLYFCYELKIPNRRDLIGSFFADFKLRVRSNTASFSVNCWWNARMLFEKALEIQSVGYPDGFGNALDTHVGLKQQLAGAVNSLLCNVFTWRKPRYLLE